MSRKRARISSNIGVVSHLPIPVTHSGLQLFETPRVQTSFDRGYTEAVYSKTTLNGPTLEFEISGERNTYIDLRSIHLKTKVSLESWNNTNGAFEAITDVETDPGCLINNGMHGIFSNVEVFLQGVLIYSANANYPHKAYIETELSHTEACKNTWLITQGYNYEKEPSTADNAAMVARRAANADGAWNDFYGRLAVDFFNTDKFLLPGVTLRIKLVRASPEFAVVVLPPDKVTPNSKYRINITEASLFVHKVEVSETEYVKIERDLLLGPMLIEYMETIPKTYIVGIGQHQLIEEDIMNGAPIKRLVLAMSTNVAFRGTYKTNPHHYTKFDLRHVRLYRDGLAVGSTPLQIDGQNTRAYYNTIHALNVAHGGNGIPLADFNDHFILVFSLTADLETSDSTTRPELTGGRLRLHLEFGTAPTEPIEVFLLGERKSAVYIDKDRNVLKNALFST